MENSISPQNGAVEPQNLLRMGEADIKATAQFVREYVTTGLIPWMEKAVVDLNENVNRESPH